MFNTLFHYPRVLAVIAKVPRRRPGSDTSPIAPIKGPLAVRCYARPVNFWSSHSASTSRLIR